MFRTDENLNPTAFTSDVAKEAGLVLGTDYTIGTPFEVGAVTYWTAKLLGDPIAITIRVINTLGFVTASGALRWTYIMIQHGLWTRLTVKQKTTVIGIMYELEGGTAMAGLFT
jgi:hypothetical protein